MSTAVVTASYEGDFERCALLCQSIEQHLKGHWKHYILVEDRDVDLFRKLQTNKRIIIAESELFPWWFRSFPDVVSKRHKRIWLSPFSLPMRGWHAQQFRRLAIAKMLEEDAILSIDSDVIMVRDYDVSQLYQGDQLRFYRRPGALLQSMKEHQTWAKNAELMLGLDKPTQSDDDYINTFIAWRTQTVRDLLDHLENRHGAHWLRVISRSRNFSECMLYGTFVQHVVGAEHHAENAAPLCRVLWDENTILPNKQGLSRFIEQLHPEQVAIGVQSFVELDLNDLKDVVLNFEEKPLLQT